MAVASLVGYGDYGPGRVGVTDPVGDVPLVVEAWIRQLLDPGFLSMLQAWPVEQVDVRLSSSRGKVRARPVVILNGGPTDLVNL